MKVFSIWAFFVFVLPIQPVSAFKEFEKVRFVRELRLNLENPVDVAVTPAADVFVLDGAQNKVVVFDAEGEFKFQFGEEGREVGQFMRPEGIAVSTAGRMAVADTGNNRVQLFNQAGEHLLTFGTAGSKAGQFRSPQGIVMDHFGFIFVVDRDNRRIQMFSPNGVYLSHFDLEYRPADLAIDPNRNLYLLVPEIGKIIKYSSTGTKLQEINFVFQEQNYIKEAEAIAVDIWGDVYLTEGLDNSVKKIDQRGSVLISFGSEGEGRGRFNHAKGIAASTTGHIYIADSDNGRVEVLEVMGELKKEILNAKNSPPTVDFYSEIKAGEGIVDLHYIAGKGLYALSELEDQIRLIGPDDQVYGRSGENLGELQKSSSLFVSWDCKIFVADTGNSRVQIFNNEGNYDYHFGRKGNKAGQFSSPQGVALNSKGMIYLADTQNNRIQVFTNDGIYITSFGEENDGQQGLAQQLRLPLGLAVNSKDEVFVLDGGNHRVQVYDAYGKFVKQIGERGNLLGQFENPVDIALDENNNLYVADQGNHRVQIFNPQGKFLLSFGAPGEGRGYFQEISSVTVAQEKIYVADLAEQQVEVFRYFPDGIVRLNRVHSIKTASPSDDIKENMSARYSAAKQKATQDAIDELVANSGFKYEQINDLFRIDSIQVLKNGQIKVTASLPADIPPERKIIGKFKKAKKPAQVDKERKSPKLKKIKRARRVKKNKKANQNTPIEREVPREGW